MRILSLGPLTIGDLAERFAISHQATRKVVDSLAGRGYVSEGRDPDDSRRVLVRLTPRGERYAGALVATLETLDREFAARIDPWELAAADAVLRAVLSEERIRLIAEEHIPRPKRLP